MKWKRFTEEQILAVLAEAERPSSTEACRAHNVSKATYYNWKAKYAGLDKAGLQEKRGLEAGNARLKKLHHPSLRTQS